MKHDSHAHGTYTTQETAGGITRYRDSGLGLGAFAKRHGLPRSRLHNCVYGRRRAQVVQPSAAPAVFQEGHTEPQTRSCQG